MARTWKAPEQVSTAAADALGGTVDESTQIAYLAEGTSPVDTPTLNQQANRIERNIRVGLSPAMKLMCRKTGTLKVVCNPGDYRKADGTAVDYEAGSTELTLTASATNYVYILHSTGALTKSTSGWPADLTTFTALAIYVCDASDIVTSDEDADKRGLNTYWTNASTSAPTGTTATAFTIDDDNVGAGVDQQLRANRGSTDAEDAATEWNETDDSWRFYSQHSSQTYCPVDASALWISGTLMVDANGAAKVAAAVAGDGLVHSSGVIAVNVDDSTLEIDADALQIKAGGVSADTFSDAVADNLVQISMSDESGSSPQTVTIQAKDIQGNNLAEVVYIRVAVFDDADGTTSAVNATIADGGAGSVVLVHDAGKDITFKTDANGTLQVQVTDGTLETIYLLVQPTFRSHMMICKDFSTIVIS